MPPSSSPNFAFLAPHEPLLLRYAAAAERYVFEDPNTALIKLRQFAEVLASEVAAATGAWANDETGFLDVIHRLSNGGTIGPEVAELLHGIRRVGNGAVHRHSGNRREALQQLRMARELAVWYHRAFGGDPKFSPGRFVPPPNPTEAERELIDELTRLRGELTEERAAARHLRLTAEQVRAQADALEVEARKAYEDLDAALSLAEEAERELEGHKKRLGTAPSANAPSREEQQAALERVRAASRGIHVSEADTRRQIDQQLVAAGWTADSDELRWSKGARPQKGRNLAIAEVPTSTGPADYVLFVGLLAVGVVEAKRRHRNVPAAVEQAKRYSQSFVAPEGVELPDSGPWGGYVIPFLFATNGRAYLRQLIEESGIHFLDARSPTNHPRALEGWYSPEGLSDLLTVDAAGAHDALKDEPTEYLGLRDYQLAAIASAEQAIAGGRRELLLAMATGTGKTRTCIGLVYRLVKSDRFRRVLFLVDRTSLGTQAADAFRDVQLENMQSFAEIYDVKELGDLKPDRDTRLHFATVQGMVRRVVLAEDNAEALPVDAYDCIVIDECHRGYNLDRDLSDTELSFRSEDDYVSKYRRVLDHFDAVKVGLTATPALHTTEIFGKPVYSYSYRQAVVDGWLVDHEPPFRIITTLSKDGITWKKGEELKQLVLHTGTIERHSAPDEVNVEVDKFNRDVITENFNKVVCGVLASEIDPGAPGKTLIFAATDRHADMVVRVLTEAFEERYGPIEDDAVVKITGNADKPAERIRRLKNERNPRVVVTVDLLSTGIDVPTITNIVFLRRVRSRILYEQMLGRATRLCKDLFGEGEHKETFRIYDAVDLYAALLAHTDMKPVITDPQLSFQQLIDELLAVDEPAALDVVMEQLRAKLHRKVRRMSSVARENFPVVAGCEPEELIDQLRSWSPAEARAWFKEHARVAPVLDTKSGGYDRRLLVSDHDDELKEVSRGYGASDKPEDYLESFGAWILEHLNDLPALLAVTQRPRDLTRTQLRELRLALDEAGFPETHLRTAWHQTTNQDIAATIIGHIRQQALGSPLKPYDQRVDQALDRILASQTWSSPQRRWLQRIAKQIKTNTLVDREAFDSGQFRADAGGFDRLNRVFDGRLEDVVAELTDLVWEDTG